MHAKTDAIVKTLFYYHLIRMHKTLYAVLKCELLVSKMSRSKMSSMFAFFSFKHLFVFILWGTCLSASIDVLCFDYLVPTEDRRK